MRRLTAPAGLLAPGRLPGPGRLAIPSVGRRHGTGLRRRRQQPYGSPFERPTVPLPVGERGDEAALVQLVIDESPSEQGLDPHGYRHVAGRRTLALLRDELQHPGDRLAVVHFADRPQPWLGPTGFHSKSGYHRVRQMLRPMGSGGGTDIRAALELGARLIPRNWDGAVVAILLSDGQDGSTTSQLTDAVERFPPGAVHVISIGSRLPDTWNTVSLGSTIVIPSLARPDEVEWATARALYGALGLGWDEPARQPGVS
jgi:hypothetical protein